MALKARSQGLLTLVFLFLAPLANATGLTCRADLENLLGQPPESFGSISDPPPTRDFAVILETLKGIQERLILKKVDPTHAPYVLTHNKKTKRVVVIVHGLLGTPLQMHPLAEAYYKEGYNVVSTLLDGHGVTRAELQRLSLNPDQLIDRFKSTLKFTCDLARLLGDEIILSGFSMGAALSLKVTLLNEVQPVALGLLAPALKEHSFARRAAKHKFDKYLEWRRSYQDALQSGLFLETQNPHFWATELPQGIPETEFLGGAYSRMPSGALPLIPELSDRLLPQIALVPKFTVPTHLIVSEADFHVDPRPLASWAENLDSKISEVVRLPKDKGVGHLEILLGKDEKDQFNFQRQVEWMTENFPANE